MSLRLARRGVALVVRHLALGASALALGCGPSRAIPGVPVGPVQLYDARAQLIVKGPRSCTHQAPPSGDGHRWCAFTLGAASEAVEELWVVDVTRAAGGVAPPCDGTSEACIRLSTTVATRAGAFFNGDTLIYHSDPVTPGVGEFLGRIFAWRPGWPAGRQICSDRAFTGMGQVRSAAAACFDDPGGDPEKRDTAEVRVGTLDGPGGGALRSIGRWPLRNDNDTAWAAAFSPDGATFGLSSAAAIGQKESLRTLATAQTGTAAPVVALDDVAAWKISNDGRAVYFVRGLPQQADLWVADFPSGRGARLIEPGILAFSLLGEQPQDQALGLEKDLGESKGEYKLLTTRAQAAPKSIFKYEDILDGARVSPDLRYTVWMDYEFRGIVVRNRDLATCALDVPGEPPVYEPSFLDHASLMFWKATRPGDSSHRDAFYAPPDRCRQKQPLGNDVDFVVPVGDRGVVLADEIDADTGRETLKFVGVSAGGETLDPGGPVRIQSGVGAPVVFVGGAPSPLLLVYPALGPTPAETGLFVYGPVPL